MNFLVCSGFNHIQCDCTCACVVACLHPHTSISNVVVSLMIHDNTIVYNFFKLDTHTKSRKVLETATRSKKRETIVEGQRLRTAHIMESKCSRLRFSRANEQNCDADMCMPPLVHVRALFFFFVFSLSSSFAPPLVVSSLSSFVFFPLSFSVFFLALSLSVSV